MDLEPPVQQFKQQDARLLNIGRKQQISADSKLSFEERYGTTVLSQSQILKHLSRLSLFNVLHSSIKTFICGVAQAEEYMPG